MISLYDILEASNGQLFGEPAAQIFTEFCIDSRKAKDSQLYVAMRTDQGDTHQYIEEAIANGATGVICARPPDCDTDGISVIITRSVPAALIAWSHYVLGKLGVHTIAVTGTWGTSVTAEAIARVLASGYEVLHTPQDYSGPLSVPLSLAKLTPEHKLVVLRLNSLQPGDMAEMVQAAQPDVVVVTHIDYANTSTFPSLEHIAEEIGKLTGYLSPTGLAVLNFDNDLVRELPTRAPVRTFGIERFGADLMAYNIVAGPSGTGFDVRHGSERYLGRWVPLLGKHSIYSVLAALGVGLHYEIPVEEALRVLAEMKPLPSHMHPLTGLNDSLLIDDSADANPASTLAALDWLEAVKLDGQRAIFIMGDIDNLGSYSQLGHRMIGRRAAEVADLIITDGREAALVGRAAVDQSMDPQHVHTTYSTHDVLSILEERYPPGPDDIILVKGGASSRMDQVTRTLLKQPEDAAHVLRQDLTDSAPVLYEPSRPSWLEIDTNALAGNIRAIRRIIGSKVALMAVIKANAYGHGAVTTAQTALLNGAEYLAVASVAEALELRDAGLEAPILVLGYTPVYAIRQAVRQNITVTLYDLELARAFDRVARELNRRLKVHVKVDTGMGRIGVMPAETVSLFRHLTTLQHIEIEGIFTHFSAADSDPEHTNSQLELFRSVLRPLRASGFNFKYIHTANSAATLAHKDSHYNMVRVGLAMYGLHPSPEVQLSADFKPVMSWKTVIAQVKTLPSDHTVGYGNTYRTQREERIAVIPVGYADGFRRAPNHWLEVLVHGEYAPIIGRVSMEKTTISVAHIPGVSIGDEVVLLGRQGNSAISAEDIAFRLGTINYEVVTSILPRVPRR